MIAMTLARAASAMEARRSGENVNFTGVSTDTRSIKPGQLFFALSGPNFDGHEYLPAAHNAGAVGAVVAKNINTELPQLNVPDTRLALGRLARYWRQEHHPRVIALTGSNGKTTVKEMLAAILSPKGKTLATKGNLNNDIGLPLTLFALDAEHETAIIEMGANHFGEIEYLSRITTPDIALITNAGHAHLEGFGDLSGVARAKGEIFNGMAPQGTAVLNADDAHFPYWQEVTRGKRVLSFGLSQNADLVGVLQGGVLTIKHQLEAKAVRCPLPGEHNASNMLAAAAAALAAGCSLEDVRLGLEENFHAAAGRLEFKQGPHGSSLIDDTYNANPDSLLAALAVLQAQSCEAWLLLGDMGELGGVAQKLHQDLGQKIRAAGVKRLFAVGKLATKTAEFYGEGAATFATVAGAADALKDILHKEVCLLVKGSRAMCMEQAVASLVAGVDLPDNKKQIKARR